MGVSGSCRGCRSTKRWAVMGSGGIFSSPHPFFELQSLAPRRGSLATNVELHLQAMASGLPLVLWSLVDPSVHILQFMGAQRQQARFVQQSALMWRALERALAELHETFGVQTPKLRPPTWSS